MRLNPPIIQEIQKVEQTPWEGDKFPFCIYWVLSVSGHSNVGTQVKNNNFRI